MAGSKQFYMKFNVKDFRTDPKVCACNSGPVGVYIMLMCLLFDNDIKGKHRLNSDCLKSFADILPRQNVQQINQQTPQQLFDICCCVAEQLAKHLPFTEKEVKEGLHELLVNNVLYLEGNFLCQKRMIKDAKISEIRSSSGKKGADITNKKNKKAHPNGSSPENYLNVLPNVLPQQNNQQKPNYIFNSNYNSNLEEDKGVSNNTSGGMGGENSGGKEEDEIITVVVNENGFQKTYDKKLELTKIDLQVLTQAKTTDKFHEAWLKWINYSLNENNKEYNSFQAKEAAVGRLIELADYDEDTAIKIINRSMANSWKVFFKLDKEFKNGKTVKILSGNASIQEQEQIYKPRDRKKPD